MLTNWPIRRKLDLLMASTALIALGLTCLVDTVREFWGHHHAVVEQVTTLADILGSNATAALEFSDRETGAEVLSSLHLQPSVEQAALYDAQGRLFASYPAELSPDQAVFPTLAKNIQCGNLKQAGGRYLVIMEEIHRDGEKVGSIVLRANLKEIYQHFAETTWALLAIAATALSVTMLVTGRLQRFFTVPINKLTQTMERVTRDGDYSLRVEEDGRDEFGTLCDGFNTMLAQIAAARDQLQDAD
jgi:two-component system, NtrC family, sensor kinase